MFLQIFMNSMFSNCICRKTNKMRFLINVSLFPQLLLLFVFVSEVFRDFITDESEEVEQQCQKVMSTLQELFGDDII
jgi:hypothetical protein